MTPVRSRIVWARHSSPHALKWCAVQSKGESVVTFCTGRWSAKDAYADSFDPPHEERCSACVDAVAKAKRTEAGLVELRRADAWRPSGCLSDFDCSEGAE